MEPATPPIRVGILEDQQLFLESLVMIFENSGIEVVARCSTVEEFLSQTRQHPPDVALVDLRLEYGGRLEISDGCRAVEMLHDFHPHVRPLVLSANRDAAEVERCFRAGAAGYLCKQNTSIYRKMDVENRTQMAMLACQLGVERPLNA